MIAIPLPERSVARFRLKRDSLMLHGGHHGRLKRLANRGWVHDRSTEGKVKETAVALTVAAILMPNVVQAATDSGLKQAKYFASLPVPKGDPSRWQWPSSAGRQVRRLLGVRGEVYSHYPEAVIPESLKHPFDTAKVPPPGVGRGHGGMMYVNWTFGLKKLVDVSIDVTFHTEPKPAAAVYLQLYDFHIGNTGQYFGFQYAFSKRGELKTKFIWSRWGTRDKADAWVAEGGWIESAGYEGDFVGIRYPYAWGKGSYTVHVIMRETDGVGTWYEMHIYDHRKKIWMKIGRLRFPPAKGGLPFIRDGGGSWCEVYGGTRSSKDIGLFHLSYGGAYTCGRTVAAREVRLTYGKTTPNCDISIDPDGRRVHVMYGGDTRRRTPAGKHKLRKETPPTKSRSTQPAN